MKTKRSLLLVCALVVLTLCVVLSACNTSQAKPNYDYLVTFDYNVGTLDANCQTQYLGVKANSLVGLKPGSREDFKQYEASGYYLEGWYLPEKDSDGNVVVDETTQMVKLATKWNFETMRVNADITLYARLLRVPTMIFVDRETGEEVKIETGTPETRKERPSSVVAPTKDGYTLYEYYQNATGDETFAWPYVFGTEDVTVYVKFIEGSWYIAKTEDQFLAGLSSNENIYLDCDLDFTGKTWRYAGFNGTINGNGHTIKGITVTRNCNKYTLGAGIFGTLGAKANIYDLVIEDATVNFNVKLDNGEFVGGFFAYEAREGAQISNVRIVNGTLNCDFGSNKTSTAYEWIAKDASTTTNCDYSGVTIVGAGN